VEASGGFRLAGQNGGEAGEAQTGAGARGEARGGTGQGDGATSDRPVLTAAPL
jgi:hypothetical protein